MGARLKLMATVLLAGMAWPFVALADLEDGIAAMERKDYAEAMQQFIDPALARDQTALTYLAQMAFQGLGQPQDLIKAYGYLTVILTFDFDGADPKTLPRRRLVAKGMSVEDIYKAEQFAIDYLQGLVGKDELQRAVARAVENLEACATHCDEQAYAITKFGPMGYPAIPSLEQLMTEDPNIFSREIYSFALFTIGVKTLPALCRIAEFPAPRQEFWTWNALQVAYSLGAFGPAARDARPCILRVIAKMGGDQPLLAEDPGEEIADNQAAVLDEALRRLAFALFLIEDPEETYLTQARLIFRDAPNGQRGHVMAFVLAMNYADFGPLVETAPAGLASPNRIVRLETLSWLEKLSSSGDFVSQAQGLVEDIEPLIQDSDPEIAALAEKVLGAITP